MSEKKKGGRPPFTPTDEQRYSVELMASIGIPQEQIASAMNLSEPTLRKHFRAELDDGKTRTIAKVADSVVRQALAGNMTAAIFYLKTQAGWKETVRQEVTGADGEAILIEQVDELRDSIQRRLVPGIASNGASAQA